MIIGISGEVINKEPTFIDIKTQSGLIYRVLVSLYTSSKVKDHNNIALYTTFIVKEDSQKLYGFFDKEEKEIFDRVLKINGVGPSTALAICSTLTPSDFFKALSSQNIDAFKKVPGIGVKSAKRILVELGDFLPNSKEISQSDEAKERASLALESLGFKKETVKKALSSCKSTVTEELIKEALKILR